jgi:GNAT superfamily N-acetyltransferase
MRVADLDGDPAGFAMVKQDELYQLYVEPRGRGRGVAAALIPDAERRIAETGTEVAWLACAIGNDRAARFYEKSGWRRVGVFGYDAFTAEGSFPLDVWRYEKRVRGGSAVPPE